MKHELPEVVEHESAWKTQEEADEEGFVDCVSDDVITRGGELRDGERNDEDARDDGEDGADESTQENLSKKKKNIRNREGRGEQRGKREEKRREGKEVWVKGDESKNILPFGTIHLSFRCDSLV